MIKEIKDKRVFDNLGNELLFREKAPGIITISLRLLSRLYIRKVGIIYKETKTYHVNKVRRRHRHNSTNSYGFNHHIIDQGMHFDTVQVSDESGIYAIPREEVIKQGKFIHFNKTGFELQIFLPIPIIETYKI